MKLRIRSVYTKLLLSFFGLLITEIVLMTFWSVYFVDNVVIEEEMFDADAQGKLMSMVLREAGQGNAELPPEKNPRVLAAIDEFAEFYMAEGWLVDQFGRVVYSTVDKPLPEVEPVFVYEMDHLTMIEMDTYGIEGAPEFYVNVPVDMGLWGKYELHAQFEDIHNSYRVLRYFIYGQLVVLLIIALLVFPVSRFITKPLRRLQEAVLQYAEGDLSSRFTQKRGDEIGELGRAFNHMANSIEAMIRSGRELVANVSHELRSPLARLRISEEIVRGLTSQDDKRDARTERHLDNIRQEVDHLDGLIGRMLEITRLDLDEGERRHGNVELSDLVQELLARYDAVREHHGVDLFSSITPGLRVKGNGDALILVVTNLLDNGFKYCSVGGSVRLELQETENGVLLWVENSSRKLAETELTAIFKPFYRAENGEVEGYGLGLSLVEKIVQIHGGTVHAENGSDGLRIVVVFPKQQS